ncbi:hypothetical protein NBRC116583_38170 [Arenicella sp. 4NH20-0111]|uniref:energy transducer TonB n=1 Tax=Arenicella sp. 4NH20-0111 TaxID=3127648 RepID=UPI00310AC9F5
MANPYNSKQNDLLSVTAFLSALLHTILILAVSFKLPDIAARPNTDNNLDVILLNNANNQVVEDAQLISSAGNEGGGDDEREGKTPLPWKAVNPSPVQSVAKTAKRVVETRVSPDRLLSAEQGEVSLQRQLPTPEKLRMDGSQTGADRLTTNARMLERERLLAKTSRDWENYQKRPRKKFVGPITKSHGAAKYLEKWKKRVVTVGNANYPIQIKARGLHGTLIMSIEINSNGTIHSIKVLQPSNYKLLNDAALRIVRDASPFEAFPDEEYFENTNILVITRAIHFLPDNSFDSTASGRG